MRRTHASAAYHCELRGKFGVSFVFYSIKPNENNVSALDRAAIHTFFISGTSAILAGVLNIKQTGSQAYLINYGIKSEWQINSQSP